MRFSFIVIAACATCASIAAAPLPDGEHGVGLAKAEFVDPSRRLDVGDPASGPRRIPAVVWYPTDHRVATDGVAYMEDDEVAITLPAIARTFGYALDELHAMTTLRMDVRPGAPPARDRRKSGFPVILFSHGFLLYPQQNSALATYLASHGYIVVSIAHPTDAADLRLEDGRIIAANVSFKGDDPRLAAAFKVLVGGADIAARRQALVSYAAAYPATRTGRSLDEWRDDTLFVANALVEANEPPRLRDVLIAADRSRLAFVGMSFGGATSATTCARVKACRAAVNLDGQNFNPDLFDRSVGRPLLLMLSDWTRYSLFEGQPRDADFSPNDLAYESWSESGKDRDVVRVRLEGIRHMGFTDFLTLLRGPKRDDRVGEIEGEEGMSAINELVLAFLDAHVRDGDIAGIDRAIESHRAIERHTPTRLQGWAGRAQVQRIRRRAM